ncbi:tRNA lysidine(34) synthetase TilS [Paraburkholderia bonniea]|uniref:tRNA lysidine(34) synthetase TilS n=1 Tax=Paraburkholderia bonniea TaxID=2152891 RepID=UPI00257344CD|nr:tRNA lysidine(34) synthetase TilS [Paraburkholderia bonniea]WJF91394.1 tRNA lysidine(34) synthetase TilS [Paraburkholderia bonniea]WJF94711.1 tRNA lysidine(34) synthetase TilS [Paraburkholderia bonniea]
MTPFADSPADRLITEALGVALAALPASARIALAFSGGVDSSVLLDAAVRVAGAARCVALHIHHGLSPNADEWLVHCAAFAQARGVTFAASRVEVPRIAGESLEAMAREVRYRALDALCQTHQADALWLGQHADDQAETVLLQLLRGSGLAGLAGMAAERLPDDAAASVVRMRPVLHVLRAQLEQYAAGWNLRWIEDESNADTRYARNALRHEVVPVLTVHFPGFRDALARTAAHAATAQGLLEALAQIDLQAVAQDERTLSHEALLMLDDDRALNLLRYWIRTCGLPAPSTARLKDAWRQLRTAREGHHLRIDHAGQALRSYRGKLYWEAGDSAEAADETALLERAVSELVWQGESIWHLPQWRGTFIFSDTSAGDPHAVPLALLEHAVLTVRSRRGGERLRRERSGPGRTLKNLFQEQGVPAWKRDVPLLFVGDELLFVPLLGVNQAAWTAFDVEHGAIAIDGRYLRIEWREDLLLA